MLVLVPKLWLGNAYPRSSASSRARQLGLLRMTLDSEVCRAEMSGRWVLGSRAKRSFVDMRSQAELGTEAAPHRSMLEQKLLRVQYGPADVFQGQSPLVRRDAGDVGL